MKHIVWVWIGVSFLPMLLYPGILIASIMGLSAEAPVAPSDQMEYLTDICWLWGALLYPLVYISSVLISIYLFNAKKYKYATGVAFLPTAYFLMTTGLFYLGYLLFSG